MDAPPWLTGAYVRAAREIGATAEAEAIEETAGRLLARWCSAGRAFHTGRHLVDMLTRIDELAQEAHCAALVRMACLYHGAVFTPPSPEDVEEEDEVIVPFAGNWEDTAAAAGLASHDLTGLGVPGPKVERVAQLITALERLTVPPGDADAGVLVDSAVGQLAVDPQRYNDYVRLVREENSAVGARRFLTARLAAMEALMARPSLFHCPGAMAWENAARDNVAAEVARARKALTVLEDVDPVSCG